MWELLDPVQNLIFVFLAVFAAAALFDKRMRDKRLILKIALSVIIAVALSEATKQIMFIERPCIGTDGCPDTSTFPSNHTAFAFAFALPLLGQIAFPLLIVLAWITGFSRFALGVHSWYDILGGIGYAGLSLFITDLIIRKIKWGENESLEPKIDSNTESFSKESHRQIIHILAGLGIICVLLFLPSDAWPCPMGLLSICFVLGALAMHMRSSHIRFPLTDFLFDKLERKGKFGHGALWFACGTFIMLGLVRELLPIFAIIWILAFGDGFSTLVGKRFGKHKWPVPLFNKNKTVEGTAAFIIASLPAYLIFPSPVTLVMIIASALIEAMDIKIDDNLTIPILNSIIFLLIV